MRLLSVIPPLLILPMLSVQAEDLAIHSGAAGEIQQASLLEAEELMTSRMDVGLYRSWTENKPTLRSVFMYPDMPKFGQFKQWRSQLNPAFMGLNKQFQNAGSTLTSDVGTRKKQLKYQSFKDFRRISFQRNSSFSDQKD